MAVPRTTADVCWIRDEPLLSWRTTQAEAVGAYRAWSDSPGPATYAAYRAAQARADAAQDALAEDHR